MTVTTRWWGRADLPVYGDVRAARLGAADLLAARPDTCAWQIRAADAGRHVTAYCLIEEAITRVELVLADSRFDDVNPCLIDAFDDVGLTYLYDTYACWVEQLLREVGYLYGRRRDRSHEAKNFDHYVNSVVKHRNEGGEARRARAYEADHHLRPLLLDFEDTALAPGYQPDAGVRVVPSLIGVASLVISELQALDLALRDESFRQAVEHGTSRALSDVGMA